MEYPYSSANPNYHLYPFNHQATGTGTVLPGYGAHPRVSQSVNIDLSGTPRPSVSQSVIDLSGHQHEAHHSPVGSEILILPTLSVKVVNPSKKSDIKLFILRNIEFECFDQHEDVREMLSTQLADEISGEPNFDFGYFKGNRRVWVKSVEDLHEIQRLFKSNTSIGGAVLWCMGKDESRKRQAEPDIETENSKKKKSKNSRYEEKLDRIDEMIDELKQKHK